MRRIRVWPELGLVLLAALIVLPLSARSFQAGVRHHKRHHKITSAVPSVPSSRGGSPATTGEADARALTALYGPPLDPHVSDAMYGPPLPPERVANKEHARRLLAEVRAGRLVLTMPEREEAQLRALAKDGLYCWPAPPQNAVIRSPRQRAVLTGTALPDGPAGRTLTSRATRPDTRALTTGDPLADPDFDPLLKPPSSELLRMLTVLAEHSTPERPLELMSLLRPLYRYGSFVHVGPVNPHSLGLAADIATYAGRRIRQSQPEECVEATLALLRDLPPGRYRLGLPKAPEFPLTVGRPPLPPFLLAWLSDTSLSEQPSRVARFAPIDVPGVYVPSASSIQAIAPLLHPVIFPEITRGSTTAQQEPSDRFFIRPLRNAPSSGGKPSKDLNASPDSFVLADSSVSMRPGCIAAAAIGATLDQWSAPWPFFPAPQPLLEGGRVVPERVNGKIVKDAAGHPVPGIARFRNEDYADPADLCDPRLQRALLTARRRGVDIVGLFPDGADHIHVDVRQTR